MMSYEPKPFFADLRAAIFAEILDWLMEGKEAKFSDTLAPLVDDIMLLVNNPELKDRGPLRK